MHLALRSAFTIFNFAKLVLDRMRLGNAKFGIALSFHYLCPLQKEIECKRYET